MSVLLQSTDSLRAAPVLENQGKKRSLREPMYEEPLSPKSMISSSGFTLTFLCYEAQMHSHYQIKIAITI